MIACELVVASEALLLWSTLQRLTWGTFPQVLLMLPVDLTLHQTHFACLLSSHSFVLSSASYELLSWLNHYGGVVDQ